MAVGDTIAPDLLCFKRKAVNDALDRPCTKGSVGGYDALGFLVIIGALYNKIFGQINSYLSPLFHFWD